MSFENLKSRFHNAKDGLSATAAVILAPALLANLALWQTRVVFPSSMDTTVGVIGMADPRPGLHDFTVPDGQVGFFSVPNHIVVVSDRPDGAELVVGSSAIFGPDGTYTVLDQVGEIEVPGDHHLHIQGLSQEGEIVAFHQNHH